jgi:hypothetical protein
MNDRKPIQLEFTDCDSCGKRVATTARRCHHCNGTLLADLPSNPLSTSLRARPQHRESLREVVDPDNESESHLALSYGGYDDFDLEDSLEEKPASRKNLWWYVAWALVALFVGLALSPLFMFR